MKTDDGGPAFPFTRTELRNGQLGHDVMSEGMSQLDHFAGQALAGLLVHNPHGDQIMCERAWQIAEMMLATKPK